MLRALLIGAATVGAIVLASAALAQQSGRGAAETRRRGEELSPRPRVPASPRQDRFTVNVTPEMKRHSYIRYTLYFVRTFFELAVFVFLLAAGWSRRMRDAAARFTSRRFAVAMIYVVLLSVVTYLISLPLSFYSGFVVPHQFDLSNQSFGEWIGDGLKALGVGIVLSVLVAPVALWMIRKMPRRWWLALWIGAIPLTLFLIVITPVFIDPLFNKFEPLRDAVLRQKLLSLASRAGIEGADVFQVDKSRQTKTMNAYVTGLGPTKRIVMWDTLLAKMTHDEVLAVMGHEMAHYTLNHVWKTVAFILALLLVVFFFGQRIVDYGTRRWGPRWGFSQPSDPAAIPWLLLVMSAAAFLLTPVIAAYSRGNEHEADVFTLELTRLNEATATAFIKLSEDSKTLPQPPRAIELWLYTHPPLAKRIRFALSYRPWETGQPNRAWKG